MNSAFFNYGDSIRGDEVNLLMRMWVTLCIRICVINKYIFQKVTVKMKMVKNILI